MWHPDKEKLLRVRLCNHEDDVETCWGEDLGAVATDPSARLVRLGNVPFLHAKPTYEDVIEVRAQTDGVLEWNGQGVEYEDIAERLHEDGGRWPVIIDYRPSPPHTDLDATFKALDRAAEKVDIAVEGAFANQEERRGRAYLALPPSTSLDELLTWLVSPAVNLQFKLVHPVDEE